jgi:hypothetical protein
MRTVQEIKCAIELLPFEERARLIGELCGWADDNWDRQMKADAEAVKFGLINEDAAEAYRGGRTKPLDDIIGQP